MDQACRRKVQRDKYERSAAEINKWWHELFKVLEFEAAITPDRQFHVLQEVFPFRILKRIISILSFEKQKFKSEPSGEYDPNETPSDREEVEFRDRYGSDASLDTARSACDDEEEIIVLKDLDQSSVSASTVAKEAAAAPPPPPEPKAEPYVNFFKRRPDRAAIWRALPPLHLEEMNLIQKAEAITEAIATDFVSWIKSLTGDQESTLNVNSVMEMFEIAMQINSATSLCVKFKEMPSVPQRVAEAMELPDMATREMLYREIMRDHKASNRVCKITAFGGRLPTDLQVKPLKENVRKKWLYCEKVPQKLETMAAVWQGITHLTSTEAFCDYLYNIRPEITPPKYLVSCHMMDPGEIVIKRKSTLLKSDESFTNISHISTTWSKVT